MEKNEVRTRFAPSPTGNLHLGGLRTALYNFLFSKQQKGKFILRIEDTDTERCLPETIKSISAILKECKLCYDEGPDVAGNFGPYIQSQRLDIYRSYAQTLINNNKAYYCFCDQERLDALRKKQGGNLRYDKHCLHLSSTQIEQNLARNLKYVIRQNVPLSGETSYHDLLFGKIKGNFSDIEDGILIKSNGYPTYNFANVIDDHLMKISHVIRGTEYLISTHKYNLLYHDLGWDIPNYLHLPPIMRDATHKLSKRHGDSCYLDFISQGYHPEALINYIALLGWTPSNKNEIMSLATMETLFNIKDLHKAPAIFDLKKLQFFSNYYWKNTPFDTFKNAATSFVSESTPQLVHEKNSQLLQTLQNKFQILNDFKTQLNWVAHYKITSLDIFLNDKLKITKNLILASLQLLKEYLILTDNFNNASCYQELLKMSKTLGCNFKAFFWIIRIALSGEKITPLGASEIICLLEKKESLQRIEIVLNMIKAQN